MIRMKTVEEIKNVRHLLIGTLTLAITLPPLPAQKIENETPSREHVVQVQTAMNHLTVIEVGEPVTTVAVGSPQSFKVERRENKVFIQPLVESVSTNLFIWTESTRLNYELVPAISDAGQMDFAIDYPGRNRRHRRPSQSPPSRLPYAPAVPGEMLLKSTPVRLIGLAAAPKANLGVLIRDVYRRQDEVFIRYSIENRSSQTLRTGRPSAVSLSGLRLDRSLWALQNSQLGIDVASRLRADDAPIPLKITQSEPGNCGIGARRSPARRFGAPTSTGEAGCEEGATHRTANCIPGRSLGKSDRHSGAVVFLERDQWNPSTRQSARCTSVCC